MAKERNVLFLQTSSELYGSGKIILQVLRIYREQGFNPVVVMTGKGPLTDLLVEEGFKVKVQNLGILRRKYVNPSGIVNRFNKKLKAYKFLNKLHEEYKFELVYSNTLAVIVGSYWAKKNKIPHIWHIHEILFGPKPLVKLLRSMLDKNTPYPIVVSEAVRRHWEPMLKIAKPEVIHNGIPYEDHLKPFPDAKENLGLPVDKLIITMIGRINPGKGQRYFLEIAKRILEIYPTCHFLLVGDPFPGYEYIQEELKSFVQENRMEESVSDFGFRKDIPEVLAASDIFVLPSVLPDSFPTVILEAMASSKPVIATRSGGAEEMVDNGKTGFLIPIDDVEKGVKAISDLINDPSKIKSFGEAGRQKVLNSYNLNTFKEKIEKHLWRHLRRS
ncbi:glycosyltransferase family 4 protein [Algoriphagus sp. SE2]|uniref:glycosyltransferase family 4 protein n=1 Tax=Algoriphagus sp. SE2 TaxID=3141536 RepID=UPI0031CD9730